MSELGSAVRAVLLAELAVIPYYEPVAVLLSGGIDSACCMFTLRDLGYAVHAYTFCLENLLSTDYSRARALCTRYGFPFHRVLLPVDLPTLKMDLLYMVNTLGLRKKTAIECTWPMLYMQRAIKQHHVVGGTGADGHFGVSKKAVLHHRDTVEALDAYRNSLFDNPHYAQRAGLTALFAAAGATFHAPFMNEPMRAVFRGRAWDEVNRPHQKQPLIDAYPGEFALLGARPHTNLQLGDSGIATHFARLLRDPDWNPQHKKSVVSIYNALARSTDHDRANDEGEDEDEYDETA